MDKGLQLSTEWVESLSFSLPVLPVVVESCMKDSSGFQLYAANNCPEAFCSDTNSLLFIVACQNGNRGELEAILVSKG